jgi:hypothetical protein
MKGRKLYYMESIVSIILACLNRIRQLEGRLLRSVVRTSPSGSLRFSMQTSGTGSGSVHSAGALPTIETSVTCHLKPVVQR